MSKRASVESRVVDFFTNAPFERADVVFSIIAPVVKRRRQVEATMVTPAGPNPVKRKRRSKQPSLPLVEVAS